MKFSYAANKFLSLLINIVLVILTGFFVLITLFNGKGQYIPLIVTGGATVYMLLKYLFIRLSDREYHPSKFFFVGIVVLWIVVGGKLAYDTYHANMDRVNAEVDLEQYEPNTPGTKAVSLEQKASLQLPKDNLLRLDGATALYPLYSAFVQATYPKKVYKVYDPTVRSTKTNQAYKNLIDGTADIIFVAGPSDAQLKHAKNKGVTLNMTPIGREAFVFFVHANNSIEGLTSDQIRSIYSGKVVNWKEVGGKNDKIRAFQRPADSGSQTAFEKFMGDQELMEAPSQDVVSGMGGVINEVSEYKNYKNAIGYTFRFFSTEMVKNENIRLLKVDGIYPDKESIRSESYPITAEFYAITAGTTNPHAQAFIDWILSAEGQELVEKTGYVPIK